MVLYYLLNYLGQSRLDGDRLYDCDDPPIYNEMPPTSWYSSECVWIVPGTI